MKPKPLALFTAAVAVLFVLTLWWNHRATPELATDKKVGQPVLDVSILRDTVWIKIQKENDSVNLQLHENWWEIAEHHDLPVSNQHLRELAGAFSEGTITRFVTEREDRRKGLGFPGRKWEFRSEDGEILAALETGRPTGDDRTFFRFAGEETVYLGDFSYQLPEKPGDWVDRQLTDFSLRELSSVTFFLEDGESLTLTRNSPDERWESEDLPEGSRIRQTTINDLLRSWGRIRLQDTHDLSQKDDFSTTHPKRKAKLQFYNRPTLEIRISRFSSDEPDNEAESAGKTLLTTVEVVPETRPHRLHQFNKQRLLETRNRLYDDFPVHRSDLARIPREEAATDQRSEEAPISVTSDPLSLPSADESLPAPSTGDSEEGEANE
ncbi:MAG: DUF4340 domain-containing protein [Opitutales bacterium]|nr:DUF4340 domain-containing protein [Opitutales bacterium]MCH8540749.1 DUF4340 domain-containing protein [Opitutales bacterium]